MVTNNLRHHVTKISYNSQSFATMKCHQIFHWQFKNIKGNRGLHSSISPHSELYLVMLTLNFKNMHFKEKFFLP